MPSPGRSSSKGDKSPHAGEKKATAAAAASGGGDGEKAPAGMTRLPKQEVTQILSLDPLSILPYTVDALRKLVQEVRLNAPEEPLRVLAEAQNGNARKKYVVFQSWVRGELDAKGYVEVPDEFIRDREEAQKQQLVEQVDYLCLPDSYFTTVEDDDGKEEFVFSFTKKETESGVDDEDEEEDDEESDETESDEDEEEDEMESGEGEDEEGEDDEDEEGEDDEETDEEDDEESDEEDDEETDEESDEDDY